MNVPNSEKKISIYPYQYAIAQNCDQETVFNAKLGFGGVAIVCINEVSKKKVVLNMPSIESSDYNILTYIVNEARNLLLSELALRSGNPSVGYVIGAKTSFIGITRATEILSFIPNCKIISDGVFGESRVEGIIDTVSVFTTVDKPEVILTEGETAIISGKLRQLTGLLSVFASNAAEVNIVLRQTKEEVCINNGYLTIAMMQLLKSSGAKLFLQANS